MTRQTWQLIVGLGWCVSMLSACSPTSISSRCGWLHPDQAPTQLTNNGQPPIQSAEEESEPNSPANPLPFPRIIPPPPPLQKPQDSTAVVGPPPLVDLTKPSPPPKPSPNPDPNPAAHQEVSPEFNNALVVALNYMLKGQAPKAMESLKAYSPATQEYLWELLPILECLDKKGDKPLTAVDILKLQKQLENLMQTLRSRADLVIDKMCFCECIKGYDNYEPLPEGYEFKPTQGNGKRPGDLVQIYLQLRNFGSKEDHGQFITCLNSTVELHQMFGKEKRAVWTKNFLTDRTPLRNPTMRNECFTKHTFCAPEIPPGRYMLTVQVVDQTGQPYRTASKTIDFIVGNGP